MHKPWHTLIFAVALFSVLGILSFFFPAEGIPLRTGLTLEYPQFSELFSTAEKKKDISGILLELEKADTTFAIADSVTLPETPPEEAPQSAPPPLPQLQEGIQYRNPSALTEFFNALNGLRKDASKIRVLHYGDSQIEGDRMTGYLRQKLQGQFGGNGPGLLSLMPLTNSPSCRITPGEGWDRYNVFVGKDARVKHKNFGVLGGFTRFMEYGPVSNSGTVHSAFVEIKTSASALKGAGKIKLFYGGSETKTWCEYYAGPALMSADSLEAGGFLNVAEFSTENSSDMLSLNFSGADSPDFYALSIEGDKGVMVDNIAMRGSSGTFFHNLNPVQMKKFYDYLNVRFIILQFGGNTVPAIKDSAMAANYGNYIRYQISLVRKFAPKASILFIGPSDMSIKEGTGYVTWPMLEPVRDAVKEAALESGCAFFDIYDCMGGKNSMPSWVDEKLAASDYTHFSPGGAKKIATMLYGALIGEYNNYLKNQYR